MIPILYETTATSFNDMGLGLLADAISCSVVEERNGEYELTMVYPESGIRFKDLQMSRIICAAPRSGASPQPFRIYRITAPISGKVTVCAQHISYQLSDIPVAPFTASTAASCLISLKSNAMETCPFDFWTDKQTTATYKQTAPESVRARLGGVRGSVLDVYGGEYEWDGYTVKLHASRGQNRGVTLRYGKNIIDLTQEETIEETVTGIVPMWQDAEGGTCIYASPVYSSHASQYPYHKTRVIDFSNAFESAPSAAQLRAKAEAYIVANNVGVPKVGIDVKFVPLWETEEYKNIAPLERVYLCDTVTVLYERLGIETTAKVTKTDYNVLLDRYNEIYIGENTHSLASTIADMNTEIEDTQKSSVQPSEMQRAINHATEMITGESGGHLMLHLNSDGEPYELLIMNTADIDTATKVWRWNAAGLGYSSTGYSGQYGLAITQDGSIVADYITTGTLSAARIAAGSLELSKLLSSTVGGDGITKLSNTGIEISATSVGASAKTTIKADGLKMYNAAGTLIGGHMVVNGSSVSAVQALYNPAYNKFLCDIGGFAGIAESVYGLEFSYNGTSHLDVGIGTVDGSTSDTEIVSQTLPLVIVGKSGLALHGSGEGWIQLDDNDMYFHFSHNGREYTKTAWEMFNGPSD